MARKNRSVGWSRYFEALESRTLLTAGAFDTSFSGDGKTTIDFGLDQSEPYRFNAVDVAVTADGKTVVAGTFQPANANSAGAREFAVARFNLDGTLDRSFNASTAHPGLAFAHPADYPIEEFVSAVAIQPDGKIVVVGESRMHSFGDFFAFAIVRFNADGSHDSSFSGNGVLNIDFGDFASARDVLIQPDGKIVVVGTMDAGSELDYAMVRLNPNGDLDSSFNSDGKKSLFISGDDVATAVAIDSLGNYVLVGSSTSGFITRLSAVRVKRDGPLDTSFDGDGRFLLSIPGHKFVEAQDLLIQGDKIVVVGVADGETGDIEEPHQATVLRLNFEGPLDTTFGSNFTGIVHTPGMFSANSIIGSADGGLIVGGSGGGFSLAAYNANGVLNSTFGTGGLVFTDFGGRVLGLAKGPGRRFVAAGPQSHVARFLDTGANVVSIGALDGLAGEGSTNTGLLAVGRIERLPFPTRVFISIGGTATGRTPALPGTLDYTLDKLVQPLPAFGSPNPRAYVEIPANQTFVFVTLTTLNDTRIEGSESAIFTIISDPSYEIGTPSTGTVTITDDDRLTFTIGTSEVTPLPKHVEAGQELQASVTWTVPSGGWPQLSSIQLRLRDRDDDDALVLLTFDEQTRTFAIDNTAAASYGPISLVLSKCSFSATGPAAPTVTVTFTFFFTDAAAGHRFALDVSADNDAGDASGFSTFDKIFIRKKPKKPLPSHP